MARLSPSTWDVAVIGAGPAGATAAAFLARRGVSVVVLEMEKFPRFHIGESLLPLGVTVLHELGLDMERAPFAVKKAGAQVFFEPQNQHYRISFSQTLPGCLPYAFQVVRSDFDHALADAAAASGAELRFGQKVVKAVEDKTGITLSGSFGELRTRYLIDASGQHAFLAKTRDGRDWIQGMGQTASFCHFEGVRSKTAAEAFAQGDILLFLTPETAWCWAIPLPDARVSVGVVHKRGQSDDPPEEALRKFLAASPLLHKVLQGATAQGTVRRCSDYGFYKRGGATSRTVAVGDAHAFLDPVFSSGVSLALFSSRLLAEQMAPTIAVDGPLSLDEHHAKVDHGYRVFERIIERFYRPGWAINTFFLKDKPLDFVLQLNTMLAGDVWRDDNPWQNRLLSAKRRTASLNGQDPVPGWLPNPG